MKIKVEAAFVITLVTLFLTNEPKHVFFMLFSAVAHELGHLIALKASGVRVEALVLGLFGGTLILEKKLISYGREALAALSGPAVNLILSLLFFILIRRGFSADLFFLFLSNLFYGLFNLLPIASLDGGTALKALISKKKELYLADRAVSVLSKATLLLLAVLSFYLVSLSAFNVSLLAVTILFYAESTERHIISG